MRALRQGIDYGHLTALLLGASLTLTFTAVTIREGGTVGLGSLAVVAVFFAAVAAWVSVPHWVVAFTIPFFALIPAAKVMVSPVIGPAKDLVTLAAAVAVLVMLAQRRSRGSLAQVDRGLAVLIVAFLGLYVLNVGGWSSAEHHGIAWAQGVRLVSEPLILLAAGLTASRPERTLNFAVTSLIATGCFVALVGIYQQYIGDAGLLSQGYTYEGAIRHIGGRLRSFGTLDDSFAYAAFLFLALAAVAFWMRGPLRVGCLVLLSLGLALAYVRTAIVISVALVALWLVRSRRTLLGLLLLAASIISALTLLFVVAGANETRAIPAGPSQYLTLNGRTKVWSGIFGDASRVPFGLGVGKVGTAADRATFGVIADPKQALKRTYAVDSGYFATVADIGLVGLAVLVALLARLVALGVRAAKQPGSAGWLVLGWLTVLLIDAVTRASFTGFPTAFLGMLLIGVGLAAASRTWPAAPVSQF